MKCHRLALPAPSERALSVETASCSPCAWQGAHLRVSFTALGDLLGELSPSQAAAEGLGAREERGWVVVMELLLKWQRDAAFSLCH